MLATNDLARKLVFENSMSESLGPITFSCKDELIFLAKQIIIVLLYLITFYKETSPDRYSQPCNHEKNR